MLTKRLLLVLAAAAVAASIVAMVGCQGTSKAPYVIGAIFSVTGDSAPLGVPERDTVEMLAKQINDNGGIDGRSVEVEFYDDKGDPKEAVQACQRLLGNENVVAIIGPSLTGTSLVVAPACESAEMPLVSCGAGVRIVTPVRPYVFKTAQSDSLTAERLVDYAKAHSIKRVGFMNDSNAFGQNGREEWLRAAKTAGVETVVLESFVTSDTDMTTQLTNIKAANPDAVVCWGTNPGPAIVARDMRRLGMKQPLLMSHGIANMEFIKLAGSAAEGVIFPAGKLIVADQIPNSDPQKKQLLKYTADYVKTYKKSPNTFGGHAWDAFMLVVKALEESEGDRKKTRDAIENTENFVGISGVFNFSPDDHNGLTKDALALVTIRDGKWSLAQ